jgi:hypothetical protein
MTVVSVQQDTVRDSHVPTDSYEITYHKLRRVADGAIVADIECLGGSAASGDPDLCTGQGYIFPEANGQIADYLRHVFMKEQRFTRALAL